MAQRAAREHFDHEYRMAKARAANPKGRDQSKPVASTRLSSDIAQPASGGSEIQGGRGKTQGAMARDVSHVRLVSREALIYLSCD